MTNLDSKPSVSVVVSKIQWGNNSFLRDHPMVLVDYNTVFCVSRSVDIDDGFSYYTMLVEIGTHDGIPHIDAGYPMSSSQDGMAATRGSLITHDRNFEVYHLDSSVFGYNGRLVSSSVSSPPDLPHYTKPHLVHRVGPMVPIDGRVLVTGGVHVKIDSRWTYPEPTIVHRSTQAWLLDPNGSYSASVPAGFPASYPRPSNPQSSWTSLPDSPVPLWGYYHCVIGDTAHFVRGHVHVTFREGRGWTIETDLPDMQLTKRVVGPNDTLVVGHYMLMRRETGREHSSLVAFDVISGEMEVWGTGDNDGFQGGVMISPDTAFVSGNRGDSFFHFPEEMIYPHCSLRWGYSSV
ncbi:hypothetical protein KIPB_005533 [Kipferlia bialata]|uniref:Uncharacterized protein n=1 Tax=Kipferlia bialata TaxID=797122 RepID=A0A391P2N7_9EUKA|nr:hypothetical protein KIPB_004784 [Kipferlia bialata]GCA62752.1 hypothetical protein KIPB_005533 [Kipferlia bialata]|eukprot:g4784.t1